MMHLFRMQMKIKTLYLEEKSNLRLCLHSRDFIPGTGIADNIVKYVFYHLISSIHTGVCMN